MANIYGNNYQKAFVDIIQGQANTGEYGGRLKVLFDEIASGSAADVLYIGKLPAGARVLEVNHIGGGTGASFSVAAGAQISSETVVTLTLGTGPSAPKAFVYYLVD